MFFNELTNHAFKKPEPNQKKNQLHSSHMKFQVSALRFAAV